jgi:hypothetical protein
MSTNLHRITVALAASLLASACGSSGNGEETVTLRLASDAACYGIEIEVDESGLSTTDRGTIQSCAAVADLLSRGCQAETRITSDEYQLSATGCFTPDDTELFECTLPKALAARFRDAAEIRCGCGCGDNCPSSVAALVCNDDANCEVGPTASVAAASRANAPSVQTDHGLALETTVSSTTTFCGTCCDALSEPGVSVTGGDTIRELRFDITMSLDGCDPADCAAAPGIDGPVSIETEPGTGTLHVCLSSKEGFSSPADLINCEVANGGDDAFVIGNVSALDAHLNPMTPPPVLVNDPND